MDGLEISEQQFSSVNKEFFRLDSEYYQKEYIKNEKFLNELSYVELHSVCNFIKKGIFDLPPENYTLEGIPFIRTSDIKDPRLIFNSTVYISKETNNKNIKTCLSSGDLVFSKIANIGDVAILPKIYSKYNFSQNVAGANVKDKNKSFYYLLFLLSKYGQKQIHRSNMLSVQGKLELRDIRNYKIPIASDNFYILCNNLFEKIERNINNSKVAYMNAEQLMLFTLGLTDFTPSNSKYSIRKLSDSFAVSGRLDAEYYQKKYEEYIQKICSFPHAIIKNEFSLVKTQCNKTKSEYPYIEIGDINVGNGMFSYSTISTKELPANAKILPKKGDLLVSKVRPNRGAIAIINKEIDNLVVSSAFSVLRSKSNYRAETLLVLLKTSVYKDWLLKWNVGTSYPVIRDENVMNMPIPIIDSELQSQIAEKVRQSFALRRQSEQLLDYAKQAVEIAIEQGEEKSMEWLKRLE